MKQVLRKCISCGEMKEKKLLWRIIFDASKGLVLDTRQNVAGRGAYICPKETCIEDSIKGKRPKVLHALKIKDSTADVASLERRLRSSQRELSEGKGGNDE